MYEIFEKLCKANGVSAYKVGQELNISSATFTSWKKGEYTPKQDKLKKIADYFNVSLEYLMYGQESGFTADNAELLVKIHGDSELLNALGKYFELPDDRKKLIVDNINMLSKG